MAWVGDANNVLFDLAIGAAKLGVDLAVATPEDYRIPENMRAVMNRLGTSTRETYGDHGSRGGCERGGYLGHGYVGVNGSGGRDGQKVESLCWIPDGRERWCEAGMEIHALFVSAS